MTSGQYKMNDQWNKNNDLIRTCPNFLNTKCIMIPRILRVFYEQIMSYNEHRTFYLQMHSANQIASLLEFNVSAILEYKTTYKQDRIHNCLEH